MRFEARVVGENDIPKDSLVVLDHAQLRDADYSGRELMKFTSIGSRLERCRFNNARIEDASFGSGREMSEYVECQFNGLRFSHGAGAARFVGCSFRDVRIGNWICNRIELIDCTFSGTLRRAIFSGTVPQQFRNDLRRDRNEYVNNDFSSLDMIDATFRAGVDLTQQRLPSGPEYLYISEAASALKFARDAVCDWPESEHRKAAMAILTGLSESVKEGQRQLFLRPDQWLKYKSFTREGLDNVFALLRHKPQ